MRQELEYKIRKLLEQEPLANRELCAALGLGRCDREVDRALQRMRRAVIVEFLDGRWSLVSQKPCAHCDGRGWVAA